MTKASVLFAAIVCLLLSACQRPIAYFQRTTHPAAARLSIDRPVIQPDQTELPATPATTSRIDSLDAPVALTPLMASRQEVPRQTTREQLSQRMHRIRSMLPAGAETYDKQPDPRKSRSNQNLRLGNRIRQSLGLPLRKELTWWQRISWKLKASVIVILVAVVFAILHVPTLPIIFGLLGAFLLISGLRKSFKAKRPWL